MKRFLSITLALALASGTAAYAGPRDHGGWDRGNRDYHGYYHRHRGNDGAAIAVGLGALALIAIMASQNRHEERQTVYAPPPPPPDAYPQDYQDGPYGPPQGGPVYDDDGDGQ